jgi:hypothetical protein
MLVLLIAYIAVAVTFISCVKNSLIMHSLMYS